MKLDKEEILKMINLILDQYIPFSKRMKYSTNDQKMISRQESATSTILRFWMTRREDISK